MFRELIKTLCAVALCIAALPTVSAMASQDETSLPKNSNLPAVDMSQEDLVANHLTAINIGDVDLPSGYIVATDPISQPDMAAFSVAVTPGHYPVTLYKTPHHISVAAIRLASGHVTHWKVATVPAQDAIALASDDASYYEVNAGLGCFMDKTAVTFLKQRQKHEQATNKHYEDDYFGNVLLPELEHHGDLYAIHHPLPQSPSIAVFQVLDGGYISYWGLDNQGRAVVLATDFN